MRLQRAHELAAISIRRSDNNNKLLQTHVLFVFVVVLLLAANSCALSHIMKKS